MTERELTRAAAAVNDIVFQVGGQERFCDQMAEQIKKDEPQMPSPQNETKLHRWLWAQPGEQVENPWEK
jgi:hypothetical protein